jgi:hypothetical protein
MAPGQEDISHYPRGVSASNSFLNTDPYTPRWIAPDGSATLMQTKRTSPEIKGDIDWVKAYVDSFWTVVVKVIDRSILKIWVSG